MAIIHLENPKTRITLFDRNTEDVVRGSLILKVRQELKNEIVLEEVVLGDKEIKKPDIPKIAKKVMSPLDIHVQREQEKEEVKNPKEPEFKKIIKKKISFPKFSTPMIKFDSISKLKQRVKKTKVSVSKRISRPPIYVRVLPSHYIISSNAVQKIGQSMAALCLIISLIGFGSVAFPLVVAETLSRLPKDKSLPEKALAGTVEPTPTPVPRKVNPYLNSDDLAPIVSQDFRIIVPKINIESIVIPNVDPLVEEKYKAELKNGVAHARGSYLPGDSGGPVVLFAHSSDIIQNVIQYNAIFYEAKNLEVGDEIYIVFNGKRYKYLVEDKKIVDPKELNEIWDSKSSLIISTCYPPGSDWKRLLIFGKLNS